MWEALSDVDRVRVAAEVLSAAPGPESAWAVRVLFGQAAAIGASGHRIHSWWHRRKVERCVEIARRAILCSWETLLSSDRQRFSAEFGTVDASDVRGVLESSDARSARSAAALVLEHGSGHWARLAVELLGRGDPTASAIAERAMIEWTLEATAPELDASVLAAAGLPASVSDEPLRTVLCEQVAHAAARLGAHGRTGVVLAAALLMDRRRLWAAARGLSSHGENTLADWFQSDHGPGLAAMRGQLRSSSHPMMRCRAWEWLTRRDLASACEDRLSRSTGLPEHEVVLSRSHLVAHPVRARLLGTTGRRASAAMGSAAMAPREVPGGRLPIGAETARLSVAAARGLPRMAAACKEARAVGGLLGHTDDAARFAAVRVAPVASLPDWCFDGCERVAAHAAGRFAIAARPRAGAGVADEQAAALWESLTASAGPMVRAIARRELAHAAGDAADARSRARWRRACAREPLGSDAAPTDALRAMLRSPDAGERMRGLVLTRRLRLLGPARRGGGAGDGGPDQAELTGDVERLAARAVVAAEGSVREAKIAATAVAALGDAGAVDGAVRAATASADGRVRANAVEAIVRAARRGDGADAAALLIELKNDGHHRVRANALRGLIVGPGAGAAAHADSGPVEELLRMLTDDRCGHRLAAAWLAGRAAVAGRGAGVGVGAGNAASPGAFTAWSAVWATLAELAGADPQASVRVRAARALEAAPAGLPIGGGRGLPAWSGREAA